MKELKSCPNCQSTWGFEEQSFQECDCCGYPNTDNNNDKGDYDEYDDGYDDKFGYDYDG